MPLKGADATTSDDNDVLDDEFDDVDVDTTDEDGDWMGSIFMKFLEKYKYLEYSCEDES